MQDDEIRWFYLRDYPETSAAPVGVRLLSADPLHAAIYKDQHSTEVPDYEVKINEYGVISLTLLHNYFKGPEDLVRTVRCLSAALQTILGHDYIEFWEGWNAADPAIEVQGEAKEMAALVTLISDELRSWHSGRSLDTEEERAAIAHDLAEAILR